MLALKKTKIPTWLLYSAIIFFIAAIAIISFNFIFEKLYQNKIYPGVSLAKFNLGGKTTEQAMLLINQEINSINQNGIIFIYKTHQKIIFPVISSVETDLAYQIINFDVEKTTNQAFAFGRNDSFFINLQSKIKTLIFNQPIIITTEINDKEIVKILKESFSKYELPAKNAQLIIADNNFNVTEEDLGRVINYNQSINRLKINLSQLNNSPIPLFTSTDYPQIYKKDSLNIDYKAKKILDLAPLTLNYNEQQWIIDSVQLSQWLSLKNNPQTPNENQKQDKIIIGLNNKAVKYYLLNDIASTTDRQPLDAKFEIKDGRVVKFQASQDGHELNIEASIKKIETELINNNQSQIELIKKELKSQVLTSDINNYGVDNVIGIGESNFSGSPRNRRHNIKIGADTLNGILIKPGEEFSLNKALGEIDATSGYLQELVIKGNKTIPEYGGGLCQIGTTMFRAALASGLPITMRRNHSYRVSYYEPAGTDATIYSPWPDLRFLNDTDNHILIQSRLEGDNLYFDFWGTKDGRIIEKTEPTIYNITKPGPTKIIETLDLPVGEKKCTERAHNGADAYFDYNVTYANGEIKEKRFTSHYIPWQAVCLIGVEKLSQDLDDDNTVASSSEKKVE